MVNKKAYMKTIEALIAVLMLIGFLIYILPSETTKQTTTELEVLMDSTLDTIMYNSTYRTCSINRDQTCLEEFLNTKMDYRYNYTIQICNDTICDSPYLPDKNIYVEDRIITSNYEYKNTTLVRLFTWYNY